MTEPEIILEKLPKKTPAWAVGTVAVIVSLVTSLTAFYLVSRSDISQYVNWYQSRETTADASLETRYTNTLNAVLSLVDSNAKQLTELGKSLGVAQMQNISLADRVSSLEKSLAASSFSLQSCETNLALCKKGK